LDRPASCCSWLRVVLAIHKRLKRKRRRRSLQRLNRERRARSLQRLIRSCLLGSSIRRRCRLAELGKTTASFNSEWIRRSGTFILTRVAGNVLVRTVGRGSNSKRFITRNILNAMAVQETGRRSGSVAPAGWVKTRRAEKLDRKVALTVWAIPRVISPSS